MKKLIALALAVLMAVSTAVFSASVTAADADEDLVVLTFSYNEKNNGIVNHKTTAVVDKDIEVDGVKALRVTPDPANAGGESTLILDCYSLKYKPEEISGTKYVGIKYKYEVPEGKQSNAQEKMYLNLLTNGKALTKTVGVPSVNNIVIGEWAEALFDVSALEGVLDLNNEEAIFKQFHFYPYGQKASPLTLETYEVMYFTDVTFYTTNPDPNTEYQVSFTRGNPNCDGEDPDAKLVKRGEKYTLPKNPYTIDGGTFLGWKYSEDFQLYSEGAELTAIDTGVVFTAEFAVEKQFADFMAIDFCKYANGIVDHKDTAAKYEQAEFDGKQVMELIPNPSAEAGESQVSLDGWSYGPLGIAFDAYKYIVLTYFYDYDDPVEKKMQVAIMTNGGALSKSYAAYATEPIKSGRWEFAVFDLNGIEANFNPAVSEHTLKQLHIRPFSGFKASQLTGDEHLYINQIMFFKDKPELEVKEAYIKGYKGGLFKPEANMSRAEACTIIARLICGGDDKVPTDKPCTFADVPNTEWYYKYISTLQDLGYLGAYSGNFLPNQDITRAEFVELVYTMGLLKDTVSDRTFNDVDASHARFAVIDAAAKSGLIGGYNNGDGTYSFKPDNTITRAEVVKVINNAHGISASTDKLSKDVRFCFNDVSASHWAFADVCEAAIPHVVMNGRWVYAMVSPATLMGGNDSIDTTAGDAFMKELDKLTEEKKAAILSTPTTVTVTGQKWYVSSSTGNDANDGKTPETAWKSASKVNSVGNTIKSGDGVFFKRGDMWREGFTGKAGVTYSAYGEGPKPVFYGSPENGADPSKWTLMPGTTNIWIYEKEFTDIGTMIFNDGEAVALKEVPNYYDGYFVRGSGNKIPFDIVTELDRDLEFFHKADSKISNHVPNVTDSVGKIYLRCDKGNPGDVFDTIEFNIHEKLINCAGDNVTFDNLCVKYTGNHGISSGTVKNLKVTNCEIGWIGGTIQTYAFRGDTTGKVTRYGNGVQIYGGCDGYVIDNCYVYQCYDAGVTHQFSGGTNDISMYNIEYTNNLFEDNIYSIEYFNGAVDSGNGIRDGKNFHIANNIFRRAGYGFGKQRPDGGTAAHVKGWTSRNEYTKGTYVIENNIFDRSTWCLFQTNADHKAWLPIYRNNTYLQVVGGSIGYNGGDRLAYDAIAEFNIKDGLGDENAIVYFTRDGFIE